MLFMVVVHYRSPLLRVILLSVARNCRTHWFADRAVDSVDLVQIHPFKIAIKSNFAKFFSSQHSRHAKLMLFDNLIVIC